MSISLLDFLAVGIPVALVIRLITVAATLAVAGWERRCRLVALAGSIAASVITLAVAAHVIGSGVAHAGVLARHTASGIVLGYTVTPLAAWFLLVLGLVAIPVAVYSVGYFRHAIPPARTALVGAGFNVLLGALEAVFVADGVVMFLFAWELMTLATSALVATEHEHGDSRRAAYIYLVMSHVGTGCLVAGFFLLGSASGSLSFATLFSGSLVAGPMRHGIFVLFLVGFGVKAGIVPLHVWLPEAHPAAPSSISALMSAVLITAGVYGLVRVCGFGLGPPDAIWGLALMGLGALSAILGVLYALAQNDLKRLLAYSTIENAGIMLMGLGAAMTAVAHQHPALAALSLAACLSHVLNHALFKGLLFLGAGGMVTATGTGQLESLGGLLRRMPWTGVFFLIGAIAISGLPPLNGFTSEWLTFQSLLLGFSSIPGLSRLTFPLGGALLALTAALAAACFVKAFGIAFLALPRSQVSADARESSPMMLVPQAWLAALCVGLGLIPGASLRMLEHVLPSLPGLPARLSPTPDLLAIASGPGFDHVAPAGLGLAALGGMAIAFVAARARWRLRRAPTWGCGGELTARTEYTAAAFSKPLMLVFRAVYRPTREVESLAEVSPYFPREVRYRTAIEPTFERYLYEPVTRTVLRVAERMKLLQAGSLHAYLAYVLLLGVGLLIWLGGAP